MATSAELIALLERHYVQMILILTVLPFTYGLSVSIQTI